MQAGLSICCPMYRKCLQRCALVVVCCLPFTRVHVFASPPPQQTTYTVNENPPERRAALATDQQAQQAQQAHVTQPPPVVQHVPASFDEALQPLLEDRIPIQPGSSGTSDYVTQPVQQLSWFPRYVVFGDVGDVTCMDHCNINPPTRQCSQQYPHATHTGCMCGPSLSRGNNVSS